MTPAEMGLSAVVAIMGGGNLWNWLASRGKTKVDLIQLGQSIATETIKGLKGDRDDLVARLEHMDATIENQDRTIRDLRDQIEELTTHVGQLEEVIRASGGNPPARPVRRKAAA